LEEEKHIYVKAHGEVDKVLKMFLYSHDNINKINILIELNISFSKMDVNYEVKFDNLGVIHKFEEYFLSVIEPLIHQ